MAQKLFDKASLVMIPSQYKEGKIYNIKPEDQSSSFEFERGSAATRVNSDGLIEQVGVGDIESVTNSDFNTTDNWVTGSATSSFTVTNGIATVQGDANGFNNRISQTLSLEANKSYLIKVRIKSNDGNYWRIRAYDNINGYFDIANGNNTEFNDITYVYNAPSGMNGAPILYISTYFENGTTDFSVDFASIKEINTDTPRLDYSGTEPALLLEPQRTNLIDNSEYPGGQNVTITYNDITSPEGIVNADKFVENTSLNTHNIFRSSILSTNASAVDYTLSIFAKKKEREYIQMQFFADSTVYNSATFDLSNGTTGGASSTHKIEDYGNGWYRCSFTASVINSTGGYNFVRVNMGQSTNSFYYTGDDVSGLYYYGFQVEQGSYPTSYIPTNGQTETRNMDNNIEATQDFAEKNFTLFVDSEGENTANAGTSYFFHKYGGGGIFRYSSCIGYSGTSGSQYYCSSDFSMPHKWAVSFDYDSSLLKVFLNGTLVRTDSNLNLSRYGINRVNLNNSGTTSLAKYNQVAVFPEALTDTELQQLTSNT